MSPLDLYFSKIVETPLLTPGQEVVLAKRIMDGDKEARDLMIRANLRLVVKLARNYDGLGVPLIDLIGEGNIGLIKAVERFDPNKGAKLSTYAAWWIKLSIKRALAKQTRTIGLSLHAVDHVARIRKTAVTLLEKSGREPADEELARELCMPVNKVAHLRTVSQHAASLNAPLGDSRDAELGDIVHDEKASDPYHVLREKSQHLDLRKMIAKLDDRAAAIITLRYGLDGNGGRTLQEIGRMFGITPERVRQIQQAALRKMRNQLNDRDHKATMRERTASLHGGKGSMIAPSPKEVRRTRRDRSAPLAGTCLVPRTLQPRRLGDPNVRAVSVVNEHDGQYTAA